MINKIVIASLFVLLICCQQCPKGCLQCDSQTGACDLCVQNYQRSISGNCMQSTVKQCTLYNNNGKCLRCAPTFALNSQNNCVKQYTGCTLFNSNGSCQSCAFGMQLTGQSCTGTLNCQQYSQMGACNKCKDNFTLEMGMCRDSSKVCEQTDIKTGACKQCKSGYVLVGYQCVLDYIDPQHCEIYNSIGNCLICREGFTLLNQFCYTPNEIVRLSKGEEVSGRRIFKSLLSEEPTEKTGQVSAAGQPKNSSNFNNSSTGRQDIARCIQYSSATNKCSKCESTYVVVNNTCVFGIEGCDKHKISGNQVVCQACNTKFELEPTTQRCLEKIAQSIQNCFIPGSDNKKCLVCSFGFQLVDGKCTSGTTVAKTLNPHCKVANTAGKCLECKLGYVQSAAGICQDLNCAEVDSQLKCIKCKSSFEFLTSGLCGTAAPPVVPTIPTTPVIPVEPTTPTTPANPTTPITPTTPTKPITPTIPVTPTTPPVIPTTPTVKDSNCQVQSNGKCIKCVANYFLLRDQKCTQTPFGCQIPNQSTGFCSICKKEYALLSNGNCKKLQPVLNCLELQTNINSINKCKQCIDGYFPSQDLCKKVSARCATYDKQTGSCTACMMGLEIDKGKCVDFNCVLVSTADEDVCAQCKDNFQFRSGLCRYSDANCQVIQSNKCYQCFEEYELDTSGKCVKIKVVVDNKPQIQLPPTKPQVIVEPKPEVVTKPGNCLQVNSINPATCLQCQNQYYVNSLGQCQLNTTLTQTPIDKQPNCQVFDTFNKNLCVKCRDRFYLSKSLSSGNQQCKEVNELCNGYDHNTGVCLSCYSGFQLSLGKCLLKTTVQDPNCIQKSNNGCEKCASGFYVSSSKGQQGKCLKLNSLCATWDNTNGQCKTCFDGYYLENGECLVATKDPYCQTYFTKDQKYCQQCIQGYFVNPVTSKCQQASNNCKTFNPSTGECYTCITGYKVVNKKCQPEVKLQDYIQDYYCKSKSNATAQCIECYQGYYLDKAFVCRQKNPLCKSVNNLNGDCTECYPGYNLQQGACTTPSNLLVTQSTFNKNCKEFQTGSNNEKCAVCYAGYRNSNGVCIESNPLCKTQDQKTGLCQSCYQGYILQSGYCYIDDKQRPNEIDPFCIKLTDDAMACQRCSPGYFIGSKGYCVAFDTSKECQYYNEIDGKCDSCLYGFVLTEARSCVEQTKYCHSYSDKGKCVQCQTGYYLKGTVCYPQDIRCEIYEPGTGFCKKCVSGHVLFDNQCIYPTFGVDIYCSKYVNSYCTACTQGSYLLNFKCRKIDVDCISFDYTRTMCQACRNGLQVRGVGCI